LNPLPGESLNLLLLLNPLLLLNLLLLLNPLLLELFSKPAAQAKKLEPKEFL
jgi:hypothetical protein